MIYTFYSYKGGVGRSMALANVAELLYRTGLRVLMVDWDLEAPGLEKFFPIDLEEIKDKPGIMDMLLDYRKKMSQESSIVKGEDLPFKKPAEMAIDIYPDSSNKGKLYLLTAGRRSKEHFAEYASSVLNFDWRDFYSNWEGELYFEWLRQQFESMADIVLMDSRTGVTEMGGVCTYQFGDVVLMFCAPNRQNLEGTYEMARNFKRPEVQDLRHGRPLEVLIVPSRVEILSEVTYLNEFHDNFIKKFEEFVPKEIGAGAESFWKLKIPYVPYYAFNELLAARDQGKAGSEPLINAFNSLADAMSKFDEFLATFRKLERKESDINLQNPRNFTVQIRNPKTQSIVGTGIIVSADGMIATSSQAVNEATGLDYKKDLGLEVSVYFPQAQNDKKMGIARIIANLHDHDDDIILLGLVDGQIPLDQNNVAVLGTAERSYDHPFMSYGFSQIANYNPVVAKGIILGGGDPAEGKNLRINPLELEVSEVSGGGPGRKVPLEGEKAVNLLVAGDSSLGLAGAAVLDVVRNLVVGIVSKMVSRDSSDKYRSGISLAVDARILSLDPFNLPIQLQLGDLYASQDRYDEAITAYNEAIKTDPKQQQAWLGLGKSYAQSAKYDEAIDAYRNAVIIDPKLESAWLDMGRIYSQKKQHENAIEAYRKTLDIDPRSASSWIGLAEIHVENGLYDEAIEAYAKANEIDPKSALNWMELGRIYAKKGETEEAISAYIKSTKIDPGIANAWQELGDLYSQKGSYNEAIDVYKNATRVDAKKEPEISKKQALCLELKEKKKTDLEVRNWRRIRALAAISVAMLIMALIPIYLLDQQASSLQTRVSSLQTKVDTNSAVDLASKSEDVFDDSADSFVLSTLLAIESLKLHPTPEGDQALRRGLALLPLPINSMYHDARVNALAFSPDGKSLVTASDDKTAVVWNAASGQRLGSMKHKSRVTAAVYSPNGMLIATVGSDNIARIWDTAQIGDASREKATINHNDSITAIAFSPKGDLIATASNSTVNISDVMTGQQLARMDHDARVNAIAFSPNGDRLASASSDKTARIWDVSTVQRPLRDIPSGSSEDRLHIKAVAISASFPYSSGGGGGSKKHKTNEDYIKQIDKVRELQKLYHESSVIAIAFSPDGSRLATGTTNDFAYLWDASIGKMLYNLYRLYRHRPVDAVVFSPDGTHLATTSTDRIARVWNVSTGNELAEMTHDNALRDVAFSSDGKRLATASADTARVWNASTGYELARMVQNGSVNSIAFSPDGMRLATAGSDGQVRIWDAAIDQEPKRLNHGNVINGVASSPDGKLMATAGNDNNARIWNIQTGRELQRLQHEGDVYSVAFSPDGGQVATASEDNTSRIWNVQTGQELQRLHHNDMVIDVAFSFDGQLLATASSDNTSRIWNALNGREIKSLHHDGAVTGVAFSPNGQLVATASVDNTSRIWNVQTGQEIRRLSNNSPFFRVAFSPDNTLVVVSGLNMATIWDAQTGKVLQSPNYNKTVVGVAFSPDGKLVATAGLDDNTARIWDAQTGSEVNRFEHNEGVMCVAFSPDGSHVASAGRDEMAYIWILSTDDVIDEACRRLTRDLTGDEWGRYMGDRPPERCCSAS